MLIAFGLLWSAGAIALIALTLVYPVTGNRKANLAVALVAGLVFGWVFFLVCLPVLIWSLLVPGRLIEPRPGGRLDRRLPLQ